jgi:hypothetical protein
VRKYIVAGDRLLVQALAFIGWLSWPDLR